mmetsp:Transcript_5944/g.12950  ORF Transcript_5944/g.12950 Transcript_5944/m.12950 type:complete len:228 (+) Transcript_5944:315-998(+)
MCLRLSEAVDRLDAVAVLQAILDKALASHHVHELLPILKTYALLMGSNCAADILSRLHFLLPGPSEVVDQCAVRAFEGISDKSCKETFVPKDVIDGIIAKAGILVECLVPNTGDDPTWRPNAMGVESIHCSGLLHGGQIASKLSSFPISLETMVLQVQELRPVRMTPTIKTAHVAYSKDERSNPQRILPAFEAHERRNARRKASINVDGHGVLFLGLPHAENVHYGK